MTSSRAAVLLLAALLVLACIARVAHLDADPYFPTWIQYVVDEGRWNEAARNLALFGTSERSYLGQLHLTLSPGYQAINYFLFRIFGVSFFSARLLAAVCGILVVVSVCWTLRRHVSRPALLLGVVILGFETNMLAQSRLALPEIPALLGMLLAFLMLVVGRKTLLNAAIAGILAAGAVGLKGTSLLIVPVLWIMLVASPEEGPGHRRALRALALTVGFVVPIGAALYGALALGQFDARGLTSAGSRFLDFLAIADPRLMVWRYFESTQLEIRNLMLLGVWFCSWIWFHRNANGSPVTREVYLLSGLWAGWWLVLWTINDYSPGRYVVHFVVPATIHVMAGLSLAEPDTLVRITDTLARSTGIKRTGLLAWLVLPTAIFAATALTPFGTAIGVDLSRASTRIAVIAALAVLLAMCLRRGRREGAVGAFLVYPLFMAVLWLAGREIGVYDAFWKYHLGKGPACWLGVSVVVAAGTFALSSHALVHQWNRAIVALVAGPLVAILLWPGLQPVLAPTYSIRDASTDLGQRYREAGRIMTFNASSLFLGNTLRVKEISADDLRYDVLVVFEHNRSTIRFLQSPQAAGLGLVQTYPLTVHPRYEVEPTTSGPAAIGVYRRM